MPVENWKLIRVLEIQAKKQNTVPSTLGHINETN